MERLRDKLIYARGALDMEALRDLRAKQVAEKCPPGSVNVNFSPGALVDVEYSVQIF